MNWMTAKFKSECVSCTRTIDEGERILYDFEERELAAKPKQYEFLNPDFLALMNDIGRLGHEKFGDDAIEVTGDTSRTNPRHQRGMNMLHAYRHITAYEDGVKHDHFGDLKHQLAAVSFNCMIEFWFSQHEQGE